MKTTKRALRSRFARAMLSALLLAVLGASGAASAANVTVISYDAAGEGFNDPTPSAPVGGNPGTTIGAQRFNAFQYARTSGARSSIAQSSFGWGRGSIP